MKILVVHRQKLVVDQVKSILRGNSPVVIYCDSGLDGLLTSRIDSFDLIICGFDLPVVTGFEVVRSIRTTSVNKEVPIIMLADEINERTAEHSKALRIAATVPATELAEQLPVVVREKVLAAFDADFPHQEF